MPSLIKLSEITGYSVKELSRTLNSSCDSQDIILTENSLSALCNSIGLCRANRHDIVVLLINGSLFRGIILRGADPRVVGITVAFCDSNGDIQTVLLRKVGERYVNYDLSDSSKPLILCYPLKIDSELLFNSRYSIDGFYDVVFESENITVGRNRNGVFFVNENGERIGPFYEDISFDSSGLFRVKKDSFYGLANKNGILVLKPFYVDIRDFHEDRAAIFDGIAWGYVNTSGEIVITPYYASASDFCNGRALVSIPFLLNQTNPVSCIDTKGVALLDETINKECNDYYFLTKLGYYYVGKKKNDPSKVFLQLKDVVDCRIEVLQSPDSFYHYKESSWYTLQDANTKLLGLLSCDGKAFISCSFKKIIHTFENEIVGSVPVTRTLLTPAVETDSCGWSHIKGLKDNDMDVKISTRDNSGDWLFQDNICFKGSAIYEQCVRLLIQDNDEKVQKTLYLISNNGKYGIVDSSHNFILQPVFDEIIPLFAHNYHYADYYGDRVYLTIGGREESFRQYNTLVVRDDTPLVVRSGDSWRLYSYDGDLLNDEEYISVYYYYLYILKNERGYGLMLRDRVSHPCSFDKVWIKVMKRNSGMADQIAVRFEKNQKQGLYVADNVLKYPNHIEYFIDANYDSLDICDDRVLVKSNHYGLLDFKGDEILELSYDSIVFVSDYSHFIIANNGFQGVVGKNNEVIVPCEYDSLELVGKSYKGIKNGQCFFISSDGRCIKQVVFHEIDSVTYREGELIYGKDDFQKKLDVINEYAAKHHFSPQQYSELKKDNKAYSYPESDLFFISTDDKVGVIDKTGREIVPIHYIGAGLICPNVIIAWETQGMRLFSVDGKSNSLQYDRIEALPLYEPRYEYPAFYVTKKVKKGLVFYKDSSFREEYPCLFDELIIGRKNAANADRFIIDGLRIANRVLNQYGAFIDKPDYYLWLSDYSYSGIAIAVKNDCFGLVDGNYNSLFPFKYDNIIKVDAFNYLISRNSSVSLVKFDRSLEGSEIQTIEGSLVKRLTQNTFSVEAKGKYGVIKFNVESGLLERLLNFEFDSVEGNDNTFIVVRKGGLFGCYDIEGNALLNISFQSIEPLNTPKMAKDLSKKSSPQIGNYLIARSFSDVENTYVTTLYNYDFRSAVEIKDYVWFTVAFFAEYHPEYGIYIKYTSRTDYKSGIVSNDCKRVTESYEIVETCTRYDRNPGFYVNSQGKWGYLDYNSFDFIPCLYSSKVSYAEETHRFWVNEKEEYYDSCRKEIIPIPDVNSIKYYGKNRWIIYKLVNGERFCGLYDDCLKEIVPSKYQDLEEGLEGQVIAIIYRHGYDFNISAVYDINGVVLYPESKCNISLIGRSFDELLGGEENIKHYQISGNINKVSYDGLNYEIDNQRSLNYISYGCPHYYSSENGDGTKNVMTAFGVEYFFVEEAFSHGEITILRISGRYIAINNKKEITTVSYQEILISEKYLTLIDVSGRFFIDYEGVVLGKISGSFSSCVFYPDAKVICGINKDSNGNKQYRLFSINGELLNDTFFCYIGYFSEGYATCVVNSDNPIDINYLKSVRNSVFIDSSHGEWGVIKSDGSIVIPMKYDFIRPIKNGLTVYSKDRKFGVINPSKRKSSPARFVFLDFFNEGLSRCQVFEDEGNANAGWYYHTNFGFADENGQVVIEAKYYDVSHFRGGIATVKSKDGYQNEIDREGNLLHEWRKEPASRGDSNDYDGGYTRSELEDMYRGAYENDSSALWNTD